MYPTGRNDEVLQNGSEGGTCTEGRSIGGNRHHPKTQTQNSVGARVDEGRLGGPSWLPACCSRWLASWRYTIPSPPTGDHQGPPNHIPATLAPTDCAASCLTSRLRLMPMRADKSAVCAINRHLQGMEYPHCGWPDDFVNLHHCAAWSTDVSTRSQ